ncbi:phenoloxidase 2-like [Rhodnius prolixus]|uniref:Tyrosinase copper-binding domain-containing protein n=1 Tax=Rhodnius prolixus TaxID=13249 RepID=T1I7V8_RHOPR
MSVSTSAKDLLYLFDRPTEPVFMPKGDVNAVFDVPEEYLVDRYKPLGPEGLLSRFGGDQKIPVKKITLPDLSLPLQVGRRENFSLFLPYHRKCAARLIEIFMGMRNLEDFISASVYCRDRVNPYLFIYSLSVAILHRPDTKHLPIPSLCEVFPDKYMDGALFAQAKEETNIVPGGQRQPLEIPRDYTGSDLDIEHRVAYFREDLGINLHHWHWHLVYPNDANRDIVNKDRRGELFYYMHQQILARYNFERLCNSLGRVKRLINWREDMEEGYFPKLDSLVSSRVWPPRFANTRIRDINREVDQIKFDIQDLERWRDRIFSAIHSGVVVNDEGKSVELTESRGIDILGNIVESSVISANKNLYGDLHNLGHVAIALCHDPENKNLETFSVMGDTATAMRDPIFYRWHAFIDDLFQEHKNTLPRYTEDQLNFPGVRIKSAQIIGENLSPNTLATYWQKSDVDLSRGLDFTPRGSVYARFTHLQHVPFKYKIEVENNGPPKAGTLRIFISPRFDERQLPMLFRDQKNLFVEMDRFKVTLKSKMNIIERSSEDSTVTIPFERTFRNLDANRPDEGSRQADQFNFCGCGWPHHMLVPKGTADGYPCTLFVMVSDYEQDKVSESRTGTCDDAFAYCGIRDSVYPDKRSMGFPFDRQPRTGANDLRLFMTPNMIIQDVTIVHNNRTVSPNMNMAVQMNRP